MARVQFTFTFTNAQPGSAVHFTPQGVKVYSSATDTTEDGPTLVLNSSNAVTVWSDAGILTAHTVDGRGEEIAATATHAAPTVTTDDGTAGSSPFGSGTSSATVVSKTTTYAAAVGDVVIADATGGDFTVTLPAPASGATVTVKNVGTGTVSVAHHAAELVEGDGTVGVGANQSYTLISDGTDWWKI